MGYTEQRGGWKSKGGQPYFYKEWNECHKDLRKARQLQRALLYQAAKDCLKDIETSRGTIKLKAENLREQRDRIKVELRRNYSLLGKVWVGATPEEQDKWDTIVAQCKSITKQTQGLYSSERLTTAESVIVEFERDVASGHIQQQGYLPDAVKSLYALDLERKRGQLAAKAANKISDNEGLCRLGREAVGSTWRRLVVDKLPSLVSAGDQIQHILTLDAESIQQIWDSLRQSNHNNCLGTNCAFESIIRRLGKGLPPRNVIDALEDESRRPLFDGAIAKQPQRSRPIPIRNKFVGKSVEGWTTLVSKIHAKAIRVDEWKGGDDPSDKSSISVSENSNSNGAIGSSSPTEVSQQFRLSLSNGESVNTPEVVTYSSVVRDRCVSLPPTPETPSTPTGDVGKSASCEGVSNPPENCGFVHLKDASFSDCPEIQSGTSDKDSADEAQGVPTPVKSRVRRRKVRRNHSRARSLIDSVARRKNSPCNIGNQSKSALESEQLYNEGLVRVDTDSLLAVQSTGLRQASLGDGPERLPGGSGSGKAPKRLLDSIPRRLQGVQAETDYEDSYAWHLGCENTFGLLPQSTQESVRTRVGYYPAHCACGIEATPLHSDTNGKVIGTLLSGHPGYSIIVLSEGKTEDLRKGHTISLRSSFGSERLRMPSVCKSGEKGGRKQGPTNDSVQNNEIQCSVRKVHKADGKAVVQAKGPARQSIDRERDEQPIQSVAIVEHMESSRRPSGIVAGSDKVGHALQPRVDTSDAPILLNNNSRRRTSGVVKEAIGKSRGDDSWTQVPVNRRRNERRHDDRPRELCLTCYHCCNTVRGNAARDAWDAVADDRRRGRFRGRDQQVLCETCSEANERMVSQLRSRVKGGERGRRVPPGGVLPIKTSSTSRDDRDGAKSTQSVGHRVHRGRKERPKRVSSRTLENESDSPSRSTSVGPNFRRDGKEISIRKKRESRPRVRSSTRFSRQHSLERSRK